MNKSFVSYVLLLVFLIATTLLCHAQSPAGAVTAIKAGRLIDDQVA